MGDITVLDTHLNLDTETSSDFITFVSSVGSNLVTTTDFMITSTTDSFQLMDQSIVVSVESGSGIDDAAHDSKLYVRSNGTWVEMPDIPDVGPAGPKGDTGEVGPAGTLDPAIANQVNLLSGFRDTALGLTTENEARYINVFDLIAMGIVKRLGTGFDYLVPNEDIIYTGPAVVEIPPVPKNLKVVGGFGHIQLFWEPAKLEYFNHYVTEVWRSTSSLIGSANLIATVNLSYHYVDTSALLNSTYYYWIRFVNTEAIHGPFTTSESYGVAKFNPDAIKDSLIGLIDESLLAEELLTPIQSITEIEIETVQLRDDLLDSNLALTNSINAEAEYRALAILNEASARGTDVENLTTIIEDTEASIINRLNVLTSVFGEGYDTAKIWQFDINVEDWTDATAVDGKLIPNFSTTTSTTSPEIIVDGSVFDTVRMRIIRVGEPVWEGALYYITTFEGAYSSARLEQIPEPVFFGDAAIGVWDMAEVSDWDISVITGLKVVLAINTSATDYYLIDWIQVGRVVGGDSIAALVEEVNLVTSAGEATAEKLEDLAIQVRGEYLGTDASLVTQGLIHDAVSLSIIGDIAQARKSDIIEVGVRDLKKGVGDLEGAISGWKQLASSTEYKQVQTVKEGAVNEYLDNQNIVLNNLGLTVEDQIVSTAYEIDALQASVAENAGSIIEVQNIAAGANLVVTKQVNTLAAQLVSDINEVTALITEEETARVTATTALASSISTVSAEIVSAEDRSAALVSTEVTARTTAVAAVASTVTLLRADFETEKGQVDLRISAGIQDANLATATELGAVASRVSTTEATIYGPVGNPAAGLSAKVEDATEALAEISGTVSATRTIKLNVNTGGKLYAAGMGITLTNESGVVQSEVAFIADTFRIMHTTDGALTQPFYVNGGNVFIQSAFIEAASITAAKIANATITNAQIQDATISFAKISDTLQSTNYVANTSGWIAQKNGYAEFQNIKARGDIEAQSLKANTVMVNTANVAGNAVTSMFFASGGSASIAAGASSSVLSLPVTMPTGSSGLVISVVLGAKGDSNLAWSSLEVAILKNGSYLQNQFYTCPEQDHRSLTLQAFDSNPAGTNTYSLLLAASNKSVTYYYPSMTITGGKR